MSQSGQSLTPTQSIDETFSYTFSTSKLYRVKATFTDTASLSHSASWLVSVSSQPIQDPSITNSSPSSPVTLTTGDSQTFSVSATDPNNDIAEWYWYVDDAEEGGGALSRTGSISRTFSYTFSSAGTFTVKAEFLDELLQEDSVTWTVNVSDSPPANQAPTVTKVSPTGDFLSLVRGAATQEFTVSATAGSDSISSWEWFVDDVSQGGSQSLTPTQSVSKTFSYTFHGPGFYRVDAEFTDTEGRTGSTSWSVSVIAQAGDVTVEFDSTFRIVQEDVGTVEIGVTLSEAQSSSYEVNLLFIHQEDTAHTGAFLPDFTPPTQRYVTFPHNTTSQTFSVSIIDDVGVEKAESFFITLQRTSADTSSVFFSERNRIEVEIIDDDVGVLAFANSEIQVTGGDSFLPGIAVASPTGTYCAIQFPIDVHFSISDPGGVVSIDLQNDILSGPTASSYVALFDSCQHSFQFTVDTSAVTAASEVVFSLDRMTDEGGQGIRALRLGEPSTMTVKVLPPGTGPINPRPPPPPSTGECLEDLGTLTGEVTRTGQWASDCASTHRDDRYARFYAFTLDEETEVELSLESSEDTYLFLLRGADSGGSVVDENDDVESGNTNSGLTLTLGAGTYTVEATTYRSEVTGSFTLSISPAGSTTTPSEPGACFQSLGTLTGEVTRTGQWASDCASTHRDDRYARFYAFTLDEETEVELSLESSEDTYLFLLRGADSGGSVVDENDDVESGNTNSAITLTLGAGTYTVEATTYSSEATGSFTLSISPAGSTTTPSESGACFQSLGTLTGEITRTGQWASDCASTHRDDRYARFYAFTLDEETEVELSLESSEDTYLFLLRGADSGGSVVDENDDVESGNTNSAITRTLRPGAYTVEATTYSSEATGSFTLSISPAGSTTTPSESGACFQSLGTLTGEVTRTGQWTGDCASTNRDDRYARFYSFTLDEETEVELSLESSEDTYLFLLRGADSGGSAVDENDDVESGNTNSGLTLTLGAGTYTVEATTYSSEVTGSFTLTITLTGAATTPTTGEGECLEDLGTLSGRVTRAAEWSSDCESGDREDSYARFYSFTLAEEREVTIDLESEEDTYLYLREGSARSGTALNDHEDDDDAGDGRNSQAVETLEAGTYTIEATTFDEQETGSFTLTIAPAGATTTPSTEGCFQDLGTLSGEVARTDEWTGDCASTHRSRRHARFYTFTLEQEREVVISLNSGVDAYLYLLRGADSGGEVIAEHDDVGDVVKDNTSLHRTGFRIFLFDVFGIVTGNTDSAIVRTLDLGTYTIEATTYESRETGTFDLTVREQRPQAIPEIVEVEVGIGSYDIDPDAVPYVGPNLLIEYQVRNAGEEALSVYSEVAAGQVFLTSPGEAQELPGLQSEVPRGRNHWRPGVVYDTRGGGLLAQAGGDSIKRFAIPLEHPGRNTVRLELVFWDGYGNEIGRDVVEREILIAESPVIPPSLVVVDGASYTVVGSVDTRGNVQYTVRGPGGATPDRLTRDKAVVTAALQQEFRAPSSFSLRLLEALGEFSEDAVPYLKIAFFLYENVNSIMTVVFHPSPAAKANSLTAIAGSVLKEFILRAAGHPEIVTRDVATKMAQQADEMRDIWLDAREETRDGRPLSFDRAFEARNIVHYHNAYWRPSARTVALLSVPDYFVDGDIRSSVAEGAVGPIEYFAGTDFLEGTLSLIDAVSVLGDLGLALEEFEPWNQMRVDIKATLNEERTKYANSLNRLGITDHSHFVLPALGELEIPHYEELSGATAPTESGNCLEDMGTLSGQATRTGEWASGCESVARDGSYARFYTFTLDQRGEITITLESDDTDTYLYLRDGNARSGTALNDHEDDDDAGSDTNSETVETLDAGTYTIEATTFDEEETGSFTLTLSGPGDTTPTTDACAQTVSVGDSVSGRWASGCESAARDGSYARFYTFTLDQRGEITITLESDDTDTYLYLRDGNARSGTALNDHEDDDDAGSDTNSETVETLDAGIYTIEATTFHEEETGSFTLTIGPVSTATEAPSASDPDLEVYSPSVYDKVFDPGERFSMSFWVRNLGGGASSSTGLRYFRSTDSTISTNDTELTIRNGTIGVGPIGASERRLVTINLDAHTSGVYYYGACVATVTGESNIQNNCAAVFKVSLSAS